MEKKNRSSLKGNKKLKIALYTILGVLLLIGIWEIVAFSTNQLFLPEFFTCLYNSILLIGDGNVMVALGYTILRLLISTVISAVLGVVLGILAGYYDGIARIMRPLIIVLRAVPTIALVLLLVIYVPNFSIYVVSIIMFPIIYETTLQGSRSAYSKYEDEFLLAGKHHFRNIMKIIFPLSIGHIFVGLVTSIGLGLKVEIMAEILAYSSKYYGIGPLIQLAYSDVNYSRMMAIVMLILIIAFILDILLHFGSRFIQRKLNISVEKRNIFSI